MPTFLSTRQLLFLSLMPPIWHPTVLFVMLCLSLAPSVQGQFTAFQCSQENSRLAWVWFGGGVFNYTDASDTHGVRPAPRDSAASWQVGNKLYILGGKNVTSALCDFWEYDTTSYQWHLLDSNVTEAVGAIYGTLDNQLLKQVKSAYSATNGSHLFLFGGFQSSNYYTAAEALFTIPVSSLLPGAKPAWEMLHPLNASSIDYNQLLITPIDSLLPNPQFNETPSQNFSPGPRLYGNTWMVGSDLYLFGGIFKGVAGPAMADLWKWNTQRNDGWAFVAGSLVPDDLGTSGSYPSARFLSTSWTVGKDLYLFGGQPSTSDYYLNDLWRFDTDQLIWEQIQVDQSASDPIPPRKRSAMAFQTAGKLWVYGGNELGSFNDLFYYEIAANRWVTVISANWNITAPSYGELGAPNDVDAANPNTPSMRSSAAAFSLNSVSSDADPQFWLFGGYPGGFAQTANDLWALKCYQKTPCGPFPFGNQTDTLVGECNGAEWIIPTAEGGVTSVNISIPISVVGNLSVSIAETTIVSPFGNTSMLNVSGCANVSLGNVVIDRGLYRNTSLTIPVLTSNCILGFSIDNITLLGPEPKCGDRIQIARSRNQVSILLQPRSCGGLSLAVIIGVAVGGFVVVALFAVAAVLLVKKYCRYYTSSQKARRRRQATRQLQEDLAVV